MSQLIEAFEERSTGQKIGIWVGVLLFIAFLFWQYMYKDKLEEHTELKEKVEKLQAEIVNEQRLARNLGKVREEVKKLDVQLERALAELPDTKEIPELLASVSDLARDAGLEVSSFRPRPENIKEFYAEVPVVLNVAGSYHEVASFFDDVGHLPRIVNINQISILSPSVREDGVEIKAECVATTFRYLDESERIVAPDKKQRRRRR